MRIVRALHEEYYSRLIDTQFQKLNTINVVGLNDDNNNNRSTYEVRIQLYCMVLL